jgi:hypothetical protein
MPSETRAGRYAGPPGDPEAYYLPRDMKAWEASWDRYLGESAPLPTLDTSRKRGQVEVDMSPEAVAARAEAKRRHAEAIAYVASYRGSWGLPLDIRAKPSWGTKYMKLSDRQVDALLKGRDRDLEKIEQARINTELWQDEEYQRHVSQRTETPQDPRLAPQRPPASPMGSGGTASPDDGWYVVDGEPFKVQWNREHTRKYAKRLVRGDRRGDRDAGSDLAAGSWEYVPGGLAIVAHKGQRMTIEDAERYGKLYGVCAVCGRTLTFEGSIERGIGPICYGRITG